MQPVDIFLSGIELEEWLRLNPPNTDLIYSNGPIDQIAKLNAVKTIIPDCAVRVVEMHRSKSVPLPVFCIKIHAHNADVYCFVRDNFYDIKLCVIADGPVDLPETIIFTELSEDEFVDEQMRYITYGPKEERASREAAVALNDDWHHANWSNSRIIRKDNRIYRAELPLSCYCEGINKLDLPEKVFEVYQAGASMFGLSLGSYGQLIYVLELISNSLE